ncbi:MAG: SurA N-terminal domain-containing protein [Gammaproteobacteria bacterium]|nr:SurA N-terminal domain-containing protein [Gammaproteobacteria bacterium]MCW8922854.1 SurA N-terminal domain-containing protein [Gammaproteobacteria bacterium]
MLQAINDRIKGWLGMAIVALIALPFAFWGIQSYIGGGGKQYIAKVGDIEISAREFESNLSNQRQKIQKQYDGKMPFEDAVLKQQVLDQLVNRKLLEEMASSSGYQVSDAQLSKNIQERFSRDGKFDRAFVEQILQSRGMTVAQMEYQLRSDLQITQIIDGIANTGFITDAEARRLAALEHQQRKISTLTFAMDSFSSDVEVTEEEIKTAYEANSELYMLPERVSVEYVELKSDALSKDVEVDEQAISNLYDEYVASISNKEQRKAKHILIKTDEDAAAARAKIAEISKQLADGALFDDLARKHSQDVGSAKQGGDLGWVEPGQMVKPFEDALFAMKIGETSDVVESQFGLHLIKLENIQSEPVETLAQKRAELEQAYRREVASNRFYDISELMATTAYENSGSLTSVAEAVNVEPQTTELFTRESGSGIAENARVREAAFSRLVLEDKLNSEVIEISPEHILVLRMLNHEPATLLPLDTVDSAIRSNLKLEKAHKNTLAAAREAKAKINAGELAIEDVVSNSVRYETMDMLTRENTAKIDPAILQAAFDLSAPEEGKLNAVDVALNSGDVALVILEAVHTPDNIDQAKIDAIKLQLKQDLSTREFSTVLNALRDRADLYINPKALQ